MRKKAVCLAGRFRLWLFSLHFAKPLQERACKAFLKLRYWCTKVQKGTSRDFRANCAHASIFPYALRCA